MQERKLLRLRNFDYSTPGAYFITTCVHSRSNELGIVENGVMILNESGKIVEQQWKWLFDQYKYLEMGAYCVMPDHFHGIICIAPDADADADADVRNGRDRSVHRGNKGVKIKSIPELVGAFKTTSSKHIHLKEHPLFKWHKSFYDVIIRDGESYRQISEYIIYNPMNWKRKK